MTERISRLRNISIDLKSFFASVECVKRGLDPLKAHLVVADVERTNKTICLAVSPALKAFGLPSRPRLFEVERILQNYPHIDYIVARPHMSSYLDYSRRVREVYLKYVCSRDVFFYSIDEAFLDVSRYKISALEMAG